MMVSQFNPRNPAVNIILLIISLLYVTFLCMYSVNQFDLGYQLSMVARIRAGQQIYKDFDYIRPFFSIILWDYLLKSIPLTSDYLILISRLLVVTEAFFICFIIQKTLLKKSSIQVLVFMVICFLHTFPIMPWHTIDGILFAVLSLFFLKRKWYLSTFLFLILTAFVKQSFFIFSFIMSVITIINLYKIRKLESIDIYLCIPIVFFLIYNLFYYSIIDNFSEFIHQVFSSSSSSKFYETSIKVYFPDKHGVTIAFVFLLGIIYFVKISRKITELLLLILFPAILVYPFFNNGTFLGMHSLFLILLILFFKYERSNIFIFFLLFLTWSSSISWGYNTPIFFILILMYIFIKEKKRYLPFLWGTTIIAFLAHRIVYTYLSDSVINTKYIFTKNIRSISGLLISENEYFYILESQQINKDYQQVIFLPGSPVLDIINTSFPNRASWEMDVEYPSWKNDLKKLKPNIVAVDNRQTYYKEGFYISSFTLESIKQKKIIKKTKYFTIYGN